MAYSCDLPKMARQPCTAKLHYGLKLQWYLTGGRDWRFGIVWFGMLGYGLVWFGWYSLVLRGGLSWPVMDDFHG